MALWSQGSGHWSLSPPKAPGVQRGRPEASPPLLNSASDTQACASVPGATRPHSQGHLHPQARGAGAPGPCTAMRKLRQRGRCSRWDAPSPPARPGCPGPPPGRAFPEPPRDARRVAPWFRQSPVSPASLHLTPNARAQPPDTRSRWALTARTADLLTACTGPLGVTATKYPAGHFIKKGGLFWLPVAEVPGRAATSGMAFLLTCPEVAQGQRRDMAVCIMALPL